jgi:hypothetical protein
MKQFYVRTENWWENGENKRKMQYAIHDKIIQYFPQRKLSSVTGKG